MNINSFHWKELNKDYKWLTKNYNSFILNNIIKNDYQSYRKFLDDFDLNFDYDDFTFKYFNKYFSPYPDILNTIKYWNTVENDIQDAHEEDLKENKKIKNIIKYEFPYHFKNLFNFDFVDRIISNIQKTKRIFSDVEYLNYLNSKLFDSFYLVYFINQTIKQNYIDFVIYKQKDMINNEINLNKNDKEFISYINSYGKINSIFRIKVDVIEEEKRIKNNFEKMFEYRDFILSFMSFQKYYLLYENYNEDELIKLEKRFKNILNNFINRYIIDKYEYLDLI